MLRNSLYRFEGWLYGSPVSGSRARLALVLGGAVLAASLVALLSPTYALAGVAAAIVGVLMLRDIRWGFIALFGVVGFLPFAALPFRLGFTPTFLDLALLAIYLVWIVRVATRRDRELIGTPVGAGVLAFILVAFFSFANGLRFNSPSSTTIRNFAELVLAIGLFFVLVNTVRTRRDLDLMVRLIIVAGAVAAAIAVVFYVIPQAWTIRILNGLGRLNYPGGEGALRYIEDNIENPMRAIGTMVDPNVLGGFLVLVTALAVPQLVGRQPLLPRRWVALFIGVDLLALYLTYSRGSLAGLAAALLVVGVLRYRRLLVFGGIAALLLLILPPTQAYVAHLVEGLLIQDQATQMRIGEYRDALALIGRYPWFGVGFAGSPDSDLYVGVSNLYLLIAEIMGVLGLAAFVALVTAWLGHIWRAWRRVSDPGLEDILLGLGAALVGGLVGGIFDHYLFNLVYPHMAVLLWTVLGIGMVAWRQARG